MYKKILSNFNIEGDFIRTEPFGSGHINHTMLVVYKILGIRKKFILRKINSTVFPQPRLIVENTVNITEHIRKKLIEDKETDVLRKVMTLVKTKSNKYFHIDENENYWCLIIFIEQGYTVDIVENTSQAYQAAKAYGKFQNYLLDFNPSQCHVTIEDFHNLTTRLKSYKEAIINNPKNRIDKISKELSIAEDYFFIDEEFKKLCSRNLPVRITHNDTKINNVILSNESNEGLCVVDLDTVMPGIVLNDFGDMIRTFTSPALEDEEDFSKVNIRLEIFDAMAKGYLSELKGKLISNEIDNLVLGGKIIVYEQAIRFLTDYIQGDIYYKIKYKEHNLNRARNQFALLTRLFSKSSEMESIIIKYSK